MRLPRVFTDQAIDPSSPLELEPQASRHLTKVLRLRRGEALRVFDGSGSEFDASILETKGEFCIVRIDGETDSNLESPLDLTLAQGITRGERMDLVLQKATELGIKRIIPVAMNRSVVRLKDRRLQKRMTHWRGVVIGASEQCGRCRVPEVAEPMTSDQLAASGFDKTQKLMLDPGAETGVTDLEVFDPNVLLWVGPEGGFDDTERRAAVEGGFRGLRLGPRILRTETAGLVAISLLQAGFGDLG